MVGGPGCDFFEPSTSQKCVVDELCGPDATAESAIATCAAALEDPDAFRDEVVTACRERAEDCAAGVAPTQWCAPPEGGSGGGAGTAGRDAGSGGRAGGGAGGSSGSGGLAGGDAGGSSACAQCDADRVCDEDSGECVECLEHNDCEAPTSVCTDDRRCVRCTEDEHCPNSAPACETDNNTCVDCTDSALHCGGDTPLCDVGPHECVQCLENSDCTDPAASRCSNGSCVPCTGPLHCAHLDDLGVCDASSGSGECVECTGTNYQACGTDSVTSQPFVCDSLNRTCTDRTQSSSGLCGECVSDAECPAGQLCVLQEFESATIGYFCMWRRGAGVGGAPSSCTSARPYFKAVSDSQSIDGITADVCTLAVSTCPAHSHFRNAEIDCAPGGVPDDSLCGAPAVSDGYCRPLPPPEQDSYRCTVACGTSDDCRVGFDCDIVANPPYCAF